MTERSSREEDDDENRSADGKSVICRNLRLYQRQSTVFNQVNSKSADEITS